MENNEFTTGQIHPIECVKEAWSLIKDDYWLLFAISIVGAMIGGITMYVLIGAMVCGIFGCYLKKIDGGKVAFAIVLVDRQEQNGRANIEARGCPVVSIFNRQDVLAADAAKHPHPAAA